MRTGTIQGRGLLVIALEVLGAGCGGGDASRTDAQALGAADAAPATEGSQGGPPHDAEGRDGGGSRDAGHDGTGLDDESARPDGGQPAPDAGDTHHAAAPSDAGDAQRSVDGGDSDAAMAMTDASHAGDASNAGDASDPQHADAMVDAGDSGDPKCSTDGECADALACTSDACVDGACVHDDGACECETDSECTDARTCTVDRCSAARACVHDDSACCQTHADCDDVNAATADLCNATNGTCASRRVYYTSDMQAVFNSKCSPCHARASGCSGGRCFAASYADLLLDSRACSGTTAECVQQRIKNGSMPAGRGCSGNPAQDVNNANCLTATEHALLDAWIAAGYPQAP